MRSPQDMEVIQIEITNACTHQCSNCTRFCGHHHKPFFMDWETFRQAVDSLADFTGIVGIMGGEPLLHPEFERFTLYLRERFGARSDLAATRRPVHDFLTYTRAKHNANRVLNRCKGPGLWTSMPRRYYDHYELIQDSFVFQSLNDHHNASYHQALLVARRDLGVDDGTWAGLRERCWIQNCWSASVSPKGAFFCEVAAALDMLFDGPGGWPLTPDWWRRQPADFEDQLHWCEMCGAALDTPRRNANDGIDDVSASLQEALRQAGSPKLRKGRVRPIAAALGQGPEDCSAFPPNQYISDFSQRLGATNRNLLPRSFDCIPCPREGAPGATDEATRFGSVLAEAMAARSPRDWVVLFDASRPLEDGFCERLGRLYLNPGSFHVIHRADGEGEVYLYNRNALAFRCLDPAALSRLGSIDEFRAVWPGDKQVELGEDFEALPATDEGLWKRRVDADFLADGVFRARFREIMSAALPRGGAVLLTQSASYFLTRGLVNVLLDEGYDPHVITHARFKTHFEDLLPGPGRLFAFDAPESFDEAALAGLCDEIAARTTFAGAVIPYSVPREVIVAEDGYAAIERVAARLGGRVAARVNIKRQFVRLAPGATDVPLPNPWKY